MRPSASRMRSASRSDGRDTPKRSTRSGSCPSESPSASSPLTISDAQLVGDLFGLLARSCGFLRRRHDASVFGRSVRTGGRGRRAVAPKGYNICPSRDGRGTTKGEAMDIGYRAVDADNHYYETVDACTRHLDKEFRSAGCRRCSRAATRSCSRAASSSASSRTRRSTRSSCAGCMDLMFRGQIPEGVDPRTLMKVEPLRPEYRDRDARLAVMDEQGLEARADVPDARVRHRAGAARRHPRHDGHAPRVQPLVGRGLGLLVPGPDHRSADAVARRSRRRARRARVVARAGRADGAPPARAGADRQRPRPVVRRSRARPGLGAPRRGVGPGRVPPR